MQQSGSANSIVATCSGVYVVDNPVAVHAHGLVATCHANSPCTGSAATEFYADVILCSHSQWCRTFVLRQTVVQEAMTTTKSSPSDKSSLSELALEASPASL